MKKHFAIIFTASLFVGLIALATLPACENITAAPTSLVAHTTAIKDTVVITQLNDTYGQVSFREKKGATYSYPQYNPALYNNYYLEFDTTGADTFKVWNTSGMMLKYWTTANFYVRVATNHATVGNSFNVQNYVNWAYFTKANGSDSTLNLTAAERDSLESWALITPGQIIYNTALDSLQTLKAGGGFYTIH